MLNDAGTSRRRQRRLRPELVLLNLHRSASILEAHHASASHQLQGALIVELRGPAYRQFQPAAWQQNMLGSEQHTGAGNIDRLAIAGFFAGSLAQNTVANVALNRKAIRMTSVSVAGLFLRQFEHLNLLVAAAAVTILRLCERVSPETRYAAIGYSVHSLTVPTYRSPWDCSTGTSKTTQESPVTRPSIRAPHR